MDLNAQNVRATVRIFGVETDMVWIQPECSYMVNISVVLKNPSDATKHEELAKYLADTFGVCVGLKLQCCYSYKWDRNIMKNHDIFPQFIL